MKRIGWLMAAMVVSLVLASCGSKAVTWNYSGNLTAEQRSVAQKITDVFSSKCDQVRRNPDWVSDASIEYSDQAMPYRHDLYGWKGEFVLTIKVSSRASISAAGNTLQFFVGSGNKTGVVTQKTEGQEYYGMPVTEGEDGFQSDSDFSVVQGL